MQEVEGNKQRSEIRSQRSEEDGTEKRGHEEI